MSATSAHVVPLRVYFAVFGLLMVLTGVTTAVAFVDLGPMNNVIMLGIALAKATAVLLYFMHLRWSSLPVRLAAVAGVIWLGHLFIFTMSDYLTRTVLTR